MKLIVDLSHTKEFIDPMTRIANNNKATSQYLCNLYVAEEINSKVIQLNSQKRTKVVVNQMYLKELTIRRNNALKRRLEILEEDGSIRIKRVYAAILQFKNKGTKNRWEILEVF